MSAQRKAINLQLFSLGSRSIPTLPSQIFNPWVRNGLLLATGRGTDKVSNHVLLVASRRPPSPEQTSDRVGKKTKSMQR